MEKMGTRGLSHMVEVKSCSRCASEMLPITLDDGDTLEGYLCFVCGMEVRL
jgi:hypothetical protein